MKHLGNWLFALVALCFFCAYAHWIAILVVNHFASGHVRRRLRQRPVLTVEEWIAQCQNECKAGPEVAREVLTAVSSYLSCKPTQLLASDQIGELFLMYWKPSGAYLSSLDLLLTEDIPALMAQWSIDAELSTLYAIPTVGQLIETLSDLRAASVSDYNSASSVEQSR